MRYIKYITAVLGFFLFGHSFLGAILGLLVGSFISFKLSGGLIGQLSGFGNVTGMKGLKTERQSIFFKTVFTLMGKLAKSDGRVSEQEIAHVEQFMAQLNMSGEHRKQAIVYFKAGSQVDYAIEPLLQEFNAATVSSPNLKQMLMVYLVRVALADGKLHPNEASDLQSIAQHLGISAQAFEKLLAMLQGQEQFSGGYYHSAGGQSSTGGSYVPNSVGGLSAAYQALGVLESDSDSVIKRAYRKLIREYHPDKLAGQGLPDAMIKEATERTQEIQTAYDLIKKNRGMR
jgi:DnaJ like chaperone protein